jgi:hypothetical protein
MKGGYLWIDMLGGGVHEHSMERGTFGYTCLEVVCINTAWRGDTCFEGVCMNTTWRGDTLDIHAVRWYA